MPAAGVHSDVYAPAAHMHPRFQSAITASTESMTLRLVLLLGLQGLATSNMYDVISPRKLRPSLCSERGAMHVMCQTAGTTAVRVPRFVPQDCMLPQIARRDTARLCVLYMFETPKRKRPPNKKSKLVRI